MSAQYSDSEAPLLALDTASPTISVAVGRGAGEPISRAATGGRSSPSLLRLIDEVLDEAGLTAADLRGLIGVRGPGSFTGLRVGLSTLLGLHRALGVPATAVSTFEVLAWQARTSGDRILPVVDALRGEWFSQLFRADEPQSPPVASEEPTLRLPEELLATEASVVGFGLGALESLGGPADRLVDAEPLAGSALELAAASELTWDPMPLTEPLYLRPPATTPPKR